MNNKEKIITPFWSFLVCMMAVTMLSKQSMAKNSQSLPLTIKKALQENHIPAEDISIIVQPLNDDVMWRQRSYSNAGTRLINHLPNTPRLPASTLKLVTTFAALDALGKDFRWRTKVYHTGTLKNGILDGDLIIQGGADPKLVKEHIINLFTNLQQMGVRHIKGDMVLDDHIFKLAPHDPAAFDNKPLRPYNAGASGLLVNFSAMILHFTPQPKQGMAVLSTEPIMADTQLPASVAMIQGKCNNWRDNLKASFTKNKLHFSGNYASGCGYGTWPMAHPNPKLFAKQVLKGNWLALGGTLSGKVRYGIKPKKAVYLNQQASPLLSSIIKDINHFSNNVMTESVFLSLPVFAKEPKNRVQAVSNYPKARQWMTSWWQQRMPASIKAPYLAKASGLCHDCFILPNSLNALLQYASTHQDVDTFRQSLSVAGESGTIKNFKYRKPASKAIGRAYIKTGTLDDAISIAGFVNGVSGKSYSLVVMINTKAAARGLPVLDAVLDWTANQ